MIVVVHVDYVPIAWGDDQCVMFECWVECPEMGWN